MIDLNFVGNREMVYLPPLLAQLGPDQAGLADEEEWAIKGRVPKGAIVGWLTK